MRLLVCSDLDIRREGFRLTATLKLGLGERLAVIGPSGAGKSTLVETIAGLAPLHAGRVVWKDRDITADPPATRPFTMLHQSGNLFSHLPIERTLLLASAPDRAARPADVEGVQAALARVGLKGMGSRRPDQLSGGERARAGLARALLQARPVLILDEPFAGLGPGLKAALRRDVDTILREERLALILVTHDMADVRALCPRASVLDSGGLSAPADTESLLANPPPALAAYLGDSGS